LTFSEHPGAAIPGRQPPPLLTTAAERIELLAQRGLRVFLKTFDRELSTWTPERFAQDILARQLGASQVVVGHDYRFGHRAAGDVQRLAALGLELGFATTVVPAVALSNGDPLIISSTKVRQAVAEGELELARRLLGRPYSVRASVVEGQKKGRTIDFPTANMEFPESKVAPPYGVMAVRARGQEQGRCWGGVANFGLRPTVEPSATRPLLEVHLFDFDGDLYGQVLTVEMIHFLRPERKFESFAALREQILSDARAARDFLSHDS
jgi:riboflavin kinase/FMN adenylyltransferase